MKANMGRGGIALLFFFYLGARWEWVVNATPRPLYRRERDKIPIVKNDVLVPEPNAPINTTQNTNCKE
jgi:hypothetical protein